MVEINKKETRIISVAHMIAVRLHYQGLSNEDIVLEIEKETSIVYRPATITWWFRSPLREFYREYSDEMNRESIVMARDLIKGNIKIALKTLAAAMERGGSAGVRAAEIWLDKASLIDDSDRDALPQSVIDKYFNHAEIQIESNYAKPTTEPTVS